MTWWVWPFLAAGVVIPVLSWASVRFAQWMFRWLGDAAKRTIQDAVREMVEDPIREMGGSLGHSIDELRESNAREHAEVVSRLSAVEVRVAALESAVGAGHGSE